MWPANINADDAPAYLLFAYFSFSVSIDVPIFFFDFVWAFA